MFENHRYLDKIYVLFIKIPIQSIKVQTLNPSVSTSTGGSLQVFNLLLWFLMEKKVLSCSNLNFIAFSEKRLTTVQYIEIMVGIWDISFLED